MHNMTLWVTISRYFFTLKNVTYQDVNFLTTTYQLNNQYNLTCNELLYITGSKCYYYMN